jgi:Ca2+-binding EF-hand superfamily protein
MFAALDSDGSGELDKAEFDTFFASHLAPLDVKEEVSLLFEMVDKFEDDGSGASVCHNNNNTTACWASAAG